MTRLAPTLARCTRGALLLLAFSTCTRRAAPSDPGPGDVAPPVAATSDAAPHTSQDSSQDTPMIDLVRDLVHHITTSTPAVDEIAAHLGAAQPAAPGQPVPIRPTDARLTAARVSPGPDGKPYLVDLTLARPISVRALADAFGPYAITRRADVLMPWPLVFSDAATGSALDVAILADVAGPRDKLDAGTVTTVTLRLDWKE